MEWVKYVSTIEIQVPWIEIWIFWRTMSGSMCSNLQHTHMFTYTTIELQV